MRRWGRGEEGGLRGGGAGVPVLRTGPGRGRGPGGRQGREAGGTSHRNAPFGSRGVSQSERLRAVSKLARGAAGRSPPPRPSRWSPRVARLGAPLPRRPRTPARKGAPSFARGPPGVVCVNRLRALKRPPRPFTGALKLFHPALKWGKKKKKVVEGFLGFVLGLGVLFFSHKANGSVSVATSAARWKRWEPQRGLRGRGERRETLASRALPARAAAAPPHRPPTGALLCA